MREIRPEVLEEITGRINRCGKSWEPDPSDVEEGMALAEEVVGFVEARLPGEVKEDQATI